MPRQPHLDPWSFNLPGGPVGVLLIHGFTGAPTEMRLLGEYLHARGMTVAAPLLPGHGTSVQDMNHRRWREWTDCVEQALADLRSRCSPVFVGGLSMGSLLTLYLAAQHPDLPGAMVYAPALKIADWRLPLSHVMKYFIRSIPKGDTYYQDFTSPTAVQHVWSYDANPVAAGAQLDSMRRAVQRMLPRIVCPLLIVHSTLDPTIRMDSAEAIRDGVGSPPSDVTLVTLHNSGHNLLVDSEWEFASEQTARFIFAHLG